MAEIEVAQDEAQARKEALRKQVMEALKPDTKTPEEIAEGKLDRVHLYRFLTKVIRHGMQGRILLSRLYAGTFWCQTGVFIDNKVVFVKYGDSPYQPIGWDTGTEFYMLPTAKLIWKHAFVFVPVQPSTGGGAIPVDSPFKIEVQDSSVETVAEGDKVSLTDRERRMLAGIREALIEDLQWKPGKDWRRDPGFTMKPVPKYTADEISKLVHEHMATQTEVILQEAKARCASLDKAKQQTDYVLETADAGDDKPSFDDWLLDRVVSGITYGVSRAKTIELRDTVVEPSEEEVYAAEASAEYNARLHNTLQLACMKSPRLDAKIKRSAEASPEFRAMLEGKGSIQNAVAETVAWIHMQLDEDEARRAVNSLKVVHTITTEAIPIAESEMAGEIIPVIDDVLADIKAAGGVAALNEQHELIYWGNIVISQAQNSLSQVRELLEPLIGDILIDEALEKTKALLTTLYLAHSPKNAEEPQGTPGEVPGGDTKGHTEIPATIEAHVTPPAQA
jgi:hypothetical protein